ncbi:MAG: Crp/Fnr family transcriptional regulator [Acidobacteriota bacterium]
MIDTRSLRNILIFRTLPEESLQEAASFFKVKTFEKNEIVFHEEDTGHYMYFIKKGRLKVSRLLPNGKEMILAFHEEGEYFGEMALIDGKTSPATVTSVTATTIYVLDKNSFHRLLQQDEINREILVNLCARCRDAWAQIEVLTFHNANARVCTALHQLAEKRGIPCPKGIEIPVKITHKELSDMVGVSRETVTRVLSSLQAKKTILIESRKIIIPDPDLLMEILLSY